MGREVRRVPLDFDHELKKVWPGFLSPESLHEDPCPDCQNGYSTAGQYLHDLWHGYVPFDPSSTGSTRLRHDTPAVRAFAERNINSAPEFYGTGEWAVVREGRRLADIWNGMWCHHLAQDDVDALIAGDRLWDFTRTCRSGEGWRKIDPPPVVTAEQVNEWTIRTSGHDSINAMVAVEARCVREGFETTCQTCQGHATLEAYPGQRAEAEAWEPTDPPEGDGWQLWETVTEGSPCSPVFSDADGLARWMLTDAAGLARCSSYEVARKFVEAGWAPTGVGSAEIGYLVGTEAIGREAMT